MSKLKNIIVINDFDYIQGGASKVAIDTANILCENYNVYFFSGCSKENSPLCEKVIKICTNQGEALKDKNKIRGVINGLYNFKARSMLKKLLKNLNRDETIIHVHGWTKCLSSSVFDISWKMKYNLILTMHDYFTACPNGGYYNYKKNEICKLRPLSFKCIKCNCDSRNYTFKLYRVLRQFIQEKNVKLNYRIKNVISISDFSENVLRQTLSEKVNIFRVNNPIDFNSNIVNDDFTKNEYYLNVSRLSKEKNVDMFCEAVTRANKKGIVAGDGPEKSRLEKKYPNIKFVGWKNGDEVKELMKKARYLVFTSNLYEGSPLTTMEALMMKLPCIVWSGCAAKDQIIDGQNGFIYSDLDSLCDILMNKELKKFKFRYNHNYYKQLVEVYKKIVGE